MRRSFALPIMLLSAASATAAPLPEPLSYAKPCPGGEFVFVAFGSEKAEAILKGDIKRYVEGVRAKYPVPGMYRAGEKPTLVYPLDGYAPDENVYLTGDGRHIVRIEGEWWRTKAYPVGQRLSPEVEQRQLDAPALRFFEDGILQKSYALKQLVTDAAALPHSPEHILWPGGAVFREDIGQFVLHTQDSNRISFDIRTGEVLSTGKMGYGNRFGQKLILVTVGLTLLMALVWALYAYRRLRTRKAAPADPISSSPPPHPPLR